MNIPFSKPIAFYPVFARCFGGINNAIYLQQLIYWSDKGKREDGYIYKTKRELEEETTLTREQQDKCRKYFEGKGLLTTRLLKADGAPTLHYKVNLEAVEHQLQVWQSGNGVGLAQNTPMEKCETHDSNSVKHTIPIVRNTPFHITENTTETTAETTTGARANKESEFFTIPPDQQKWKDIALMVGLTEEEAEVSYDNFQANSWRRRNKIPLESWDAVRGALKYWRNNRQRFPAKREETVEERLERLRRERGIRKQGAS